MDAEEILLADLILQNEDQAEELAEAPPRQFLPRINAFEHLSDNLFKKYFRMSKVSVRNIIQTVTPFMQQPTRSSALSIETKVLVTLSFLGSGSYQAITGSSIYTAVTQASTSRCIAEICSALTEPIIFNEWVHFPRTIQELEALRARFYIKYNFPGIVGCIDCTHVAIVAPTHDDPDRPEHLYVNRKGYHSLNVQLICDEKLRIINVNPRFPGSTHDAHIWHNSNISQVMEQLYRNDENNLFYLLGDSGYPLRPWLLTPLRDVEENTPEARFNNTFTRIRSLIEQCNGLLKARFRCLLKHRVLHYSPTKAAQIVNACAVLHNMCIENNDIVDVEGNIEHDLGVYEHMPQNEMHFAGHPDLAAARQIQNNLLRTIFT